MKLLTNLDCTAPPMSGIGHYTRQLLLRLAIHPDVHACRGLYRNRCLDATQITQWLSVPDDNLMADGGWQASLRRQLRNLPGGYTLRHRLRMWRFSRMTRPFSDHVYWEPGLELGSFKGQKVASLYDLSHLVVPESHPPTRVAYLTHQIDHTLRHANHLVTISDTMRQEIADYSGLNPSTISVVPPAADPAFRPLTGNEKRETRERLGLPERFILTLGTLEPRKNLLRLAQAYEALPARLRRRWPLVCVGSKGWNDSSLTKVLDRLQQRNELIRLGYVKQADLPLIAATADLLAYPSLYEGFGMPVVEAMASGTPVLTSQGTAMEEVSGDSAFLVNPLDIDNIHRVLHDALEDHDGRLRKGMQGPEVAARYNWDESTAKLLDTFRVTSE